MRELVRGLARGSPTVVGSSTAFLVLLAATVAWIAVETEFDRLRHEDDR